MEDEKTIEITEENSKIISEEITEEEYIEVVGDSEEVYNEREEDVK